MPLELKLNEGDKAPEFSGLTQAGSKVTLSELKGRDVVLYFYPRDNTPDCTKEACGFRDETSEFVKRGAVVLGVSADSAESHQKFAKKYKLPFPLLVDPGQEIARAFGVWGEKSFFGRKYSGMHRVTFLIGPDGRIKRIWTKVKAKGHAKEVLAALEGNKTK